MPTSPLSPPASAGSLGAQASPKRQAEIYAAVTGGDLGQRIRTLPASIQARLRSKLAGTELPVRDKHRVRFLGELAGLSARLLERGRPQVERATGLLSRGGYHEGIALPELETIATILTLIRELAAIAMRSSKPPDYLRLLSRPGVDIERFVSTMSFFANDRHVRLKALDMERRRVALQMERCARQRSTTALRALLSHIVARIPEPAQGTHQYNSDWRVLHAFDIAASMVRDQRALLRLLRRDHARLINDQSFFQLDEMVERLAKSGDDRALQRHCHQFLVACGIYLAGGGSLLRFGKMFKEGPIEGYVLLKPDSLRSYGCEALTTADVSDPTALLASEKEHTIQHELQHVFDKIIYVESALRTMDDATGQTQSNLLGMEYRARLAEMAFTHDLGLVEEAMREVRDNLGEQQVQGYAMDIRVQADRLVYERMRRCTRGPALRRLARRLIDLAYRQAYGLTYTQIVEPFAGGR